MLLLRFTAVLISVSHNDPLFLFCEWFASLVFSICIGVHTCSIEFTEKAHLLSPKVFHNVHVSCDRNLMGCYWYSCTDRVFIIYTYRLKRLIAFLYCRGVGYQFLPRATIITIIIQSKYGYKSLDVHRSTSRISSNGGKLTVKYPSSEVTHAVSFKNDTAVSLPISPQKLAWRR